jgi:hypothetical protein
MGKKLFIDLPRTLRNRPNIEESSISAAFELIYFEDVVCDNVIMLTKTYDKLRDQLTKNPLVRGLELDTITEIVNSVKWGFISKIVLVKCLDIILMERNYVAKLVRIVAINSDNRYPHLLGELNEYALSLI